MCECCCGVGVIDHFVTARYAEFELHVYLTLVFVISLQ
jgi:hypothetical protein